MTCVHWDVLNWCLFCRFRRYAQSSAEMKKKHGCCGNSLIKNKVSESSVLLEEGVLLSDWLNVLWSSGGGEGGLKVPCSSELGRGLQVHASSRGRECVQVLLWTGRGEEHKMLLKTSGGGGGGGGVLLWSNGGGELKVLLSIGRGGVLLSNDRGGGLKVLPPSGGVFPFRPLFSKLQDQRLMIF